MLEQFTRFGRQLFLQGANSSHSGKMSVRAGDRIFITRRGSMLCDPLAIVHAHPPFAVGQMLEEAYQCTSSLEASCKTLFPHRLLSPRGGEEGEGRW